MIANHSQKAWRPSPPLLKTWENIVTAAPDADDLIRNVVDRIASLSPETWADMSTASNAVRRDHYLIRYGLPVAEIAGWPGKRTPFLIDSLALHFLWEVTWRCLDDVLDCPTLTTPKAITHLVQSLVRACLIHAQFLDRKAGNLLVSGVLDLLTQTCSVASEEKKRPIPSHRIWERASPFLIVPRTVLRFSAAEERFYCDYLCLNGLVHDINDLSDDLKLGIHSLPSRWLTEIDPEAAFRPLVLRKWFKRASSELAKRIQIVRKHPTRRHLPVISIFLREAEEIAGDLYPEEHHADRH